jgi:hypothetical protein
MTQDLPMQSPDELLGQGFEFRPSWWAPKVGPPEWSDFLHDLPPVGDGYHRITRADLLRAAPPDRPDLIARYLVAAYTWGTGPSAFLVGRRARTFRDTSPERITTALQDAHAVLKSDGPVEAYRSMLRGGPNNIKYLGPSFFTKFLYAADSKNGEPGRALILDRLVAIALNDLEGWSLREQGPWTADQYGRWLDYARQRAEDTPGPASGTRSDAVELALFKHGRKIYDARKATRRKG